ncbi:uncharacterized protein ARMOST_14462 [Armillaria ostoyae]|uniref:Uncharacterized protein n=1 Tax=Armillaria ostoyae TaxID=47428 RepID=A0A284RQM9_ARMOS|nr:uncharacterized protein ARMOST_14462 [Armillaria ostoyae]
MDELSEEERELEEMDNSIRIRGFKTIVLIGCVKTQQEEKQEKDHFHAEYSHPRRSPAVSMLFVPTRCILSMPSLAWDSTPLSGFWHHNRKRPRVTAGSNGWCCLLASPHLHCLIALPFLSSYEPRHQTSRRSYDASNKPAISQRNDSVISYKGRLRMQPTRSERMTRPFLVREVSEAVSGLSKALAPPMTLDNTSPPSASQSKHQTSVEWNYDEAWRVLDDRDGNDKAIRGTGPTCQGMENVPALDLTPRCWKVSCLLFRHPRTFKSNELSARSLHVPTSVHSPVHVDSRHPSTSLVGYHYPFSRHQEADANKSAISQHKGSTSAPRAYPSRSAIFSIIILEPSLLTTVSDFAPNDVGKYQAFVEENHAQQEVVRFLPAHPQIPEIPSTNTEFLILCPARKKGLTQDDVRRATEDRIGMGIHAVYSRQRIEQAPSVAEPDWDWAPNCSFLPCGYLYVR